MTDLRKLLSRSVEQHQQLYNCLRGIEKRLSLLDLESTVEATVELENRFNRIQHTDREILSLLRPMDTDRYRDLLEQRLQLGRDLVDLYATLTPKLRTRLAGYRAELVKIRQGLQTMNGYSSTGTTAGGLINTSN